MTKNYREWIVQRNRQKRAYEALYHDIAVYSGLSDTVLWILYTLMDADGRMSQQDLVDKWFFPKQTINSAVQNLSTKGYVTLSVVPHTGNRKLVQLTESGRTLVNSTVVLLAEAEFHAASHMTEEERTVYLSLSRKYYGFPEEETRMLRRQSGGVTLGK